MRYYNEIDPYCCAWLRNLMGAGLIPQGEIDGRDIRDVQPRDLDGFTQYHFFAGIAGWAYALRLAGWPDDRPVWTGSCPCQPFSQAGGRKGTADERHVWPAWFHLIEQCHPPILFGEQVASKDGLAWLDLVHADLEGAGYAVGAADLCAASVGAPHVRQRLWFVADHICQGLEINGQQPTWEERAASQRSGEVGSLGNASGEQMGRAGPRKDFWWDCEWLPCRDGKARPVKPGIQPLAYGVPARVAKLRAVGNAIVPQVAAEFVRAYMEERRNG